MELRPLSLDDALEVLPWRNAVPETLRTAKMLTECEQTDWWEREIANRESRTRYWGLWRDGMPEGWGFIGYGGIEHISWENGTGEISLLIDPERRGKGYGRQAVGLFLREAFNNLRLEFVRGRCYLCSPAVSFWKKACSVYDGDWYVPMLTTDEVKRRDGVFYGVLAFGWSRVSWGGYGPGSKEEANGV